MSLWRKLRDPSQVTQQVLRIRHGRRASHRHCRRHAHTGRRVLAQDQHQPSQQVKVALREQPSRSALRVGVVRPADQPYMSLLESRVVDGENWFCVRMTGGRSGWALLPDTIAQPLVDSTTTSASTTSSSDAASRLPSQTISTAEASTTTASNTGSISPASTSTSAAPGMLQSMVQQMAAAQTQNHDGDSDSDSSKNQTAASPPVTSSASASAWGSPDEQQEEDNEHYAMYGVTPDELEQDLRHFSDEDGDYNNFDADDDVGGGEQHEHQPPSHVNITQRLHQEREQNQHQPQHQPLPSWPSPSSISSFSPSSPATQSSQSAYSSHPYSRDAFDVVAQKMRALNTAIHMETIPAPSTAEEQQRNRHVLALRLRSILDVLSYHRRIAGVDASLDARVLAAALAGLARISPRVWHKVLRHRGFAVLCQQLAATRSVALDDASSVQSAVINLLMSRRDRGHVSTGVLAELRSCLELRRAMQRLLEGVMTAAFGAQSALEHGPPGHADDAVDDVDDIDDFVDDVDDVSDDTAQTRAGGDERVRVLAQSALLHSIFHLDSPLIFEAFDRHISTSRKAAHTVDVECIRNLALAVKVAAQDYTRPPASQRQLIGTAVAAFVARQDAPQMLVPELENHTTLAAVALMATHVSDSSDCCALLAPVVETALEHVDEAPTAALGVIAWSLGRVDADHRPHQAGPYLAAVLRLLRMRRAAVHMTDAYNAGVTSGTILDRTVLDRAAMRDLFDERELRRLAKEERTEADTLDKGARDREVAGHKGSLDGEAASSSDRSTLHGDDDDESDADVDDVDDVGGDHARSTVLVTEEGVRVEFVDNKPVFPEISGFLRFSPADMANLAFAAKNMGVTEHRAFSMLTGRDRHSMFRYRSDFPVMQLKASSLAERTHFDMANRFITEAPSDRSLATQRAMAQRQLEKMAARGEELQALEAEEENEDEEDMHDDNDVNLNHTSGEDTSSSSSSPSSSSSSSSAAAAEKKSGKKRKGKKLTKEEAALAALHVQRVLRGVSTLYIDRIVRDSTLLDVLGVCNGVLALASDNDIALRSRDTLQRMVDELRSKWGVGDNYVTDTNAFVLMAEACDAAVSELTEALAAKETLKLKEKEEALRRREEQVLLLQRQQEQQSRLHEETAWMDDVGTARSDELAMGTHRETIDEEVMDEQQSLVHHQGSDDGGDDGENSEDHEVLAGTGEGSGEAAPGGQQEDEMLRDTGTGGDVADDLSSGDDAQWLADQRVGGDGGDGEGESRGGTTGSEDVVAPQHGSGVVEGESLHDQLMSMWATNSSSSVSSLTAPASSSSPPPGSPLSSTAAEDSARVDGSPSTTPEEAAREHARALTSPLVDVLTTMTKRADQHVLSRRQGTHRGAHARFWTSTGTVSAIHRRVTKDAGRLGLQTTTRAQVLEKLLKLKGRDLKMLAKGLGLKSSGTKLDISRHILHSSLRLEEVEQLAHNPHLIEEIPREFQ
ncbi:hypothetical protein PTSG_12269 [Salpingoeca rosetta]|uniref:Uncharacterized protein n=1 Tax=Salpingoeca rosetta (strain ATCC 50818 / BSB-021) TaxID=946362 RepID=F2UAQ1_SALR5|nr:uncharacterized protein PTSG_12269 [Salpingoeca rosetta]EGD73467.1 hypothetical protein PTSG_12269 [Salpingoeca rosetta]|eukprot:XP_004993749.1 hypothetical protein PTSG_12269 [Salpingoeca rosetta]